VTLAEVPCQGAAVVYQYLNAPYTQSPELFPPLQSGVLTAAERAGALLVRLENVHITPVTGGSFPGWSQAAQLLQQVWMARNASTGASPGTRAAAAMAAAQPYTGLEQYYSIACNEAPSPPASAFVGLQRLVLRRGGVIGLPYLWSLDEPCATWPVRGRDTYSGPWNAPTSPILVIGNTTDPFLPLRDAIAMTRQLANARLLIVRGYGHTAFLNPSTCASNYLTAYFRTGALPPKGAVCRQDLQPFAPPAG
jgi:pimeloyl-ACP methyl ester carboxylesterase